MDSQSQPNDMSSFFEQAKKKKQQKKTKEQKKQQDEQLKKKEEQELQQKKDQQVKEEFSDDDVQAPILIGGTKVKDIKEVKKAQQEKQKEDDPNAEVNNQDWTFMKAKQDRPIVEKTESKEPKKTGEINFKQGKQRFTSKKNNMGKNFMEFPDLKEDQKDGEGKLSDIQQQQRYLEDKYQVSSSAVGGKRPREGEGEKPEEKKEAKRPMFTGKAKLNKQTENDDILTVKYDETKIASTAKGAKKDREENKSGEKDVDDDQEQKSEDRDNNKQKRNNRKFQDFDQDKQQQQMQDDDGFDIVTDNKRQRKPKDIFDEDRKQKRPMFHRGGEGGPKKFTNSKKDNQQNRPLEPVEKKQEDKKEPAKWSQEADLKDQKLDWGSALKK